MTVDWSSRTERLVARVYLADGQLAVNNVAGSWENVIERPLWDARTHETVDPREDPTRFFRLLPAALNGSYVDVTSVHTGNRCPFAESVEVPMQSLDLSVSGNGRRRRR